ncbi:MAG: sugar phosphate isomerase/epimerase family protein [Anaerolineales bacterium]
MFRIGVTQWSLSRGGAEALFQAAQLGFTAIQLDAGALDSDLLLSSASLQKAYAQAMRESGVAISAIAPGYLNDYGMTSPVGSLNARRCWDVIQIAIDAALNLNVPLVFLPSFRTSEIHTEADLMRTAEVLRQACVYAAGHNLEVATENTLDVPGNLKLLEAVGQPKLRVLLDTLNPVLWGHDVPTMIRDLWPHLSKQIHVKDGMTGQMGNAPLGMGDGGFVAAMKTLRSLGFNGTLISENDYTGEREMWAARDLAVLAEFSRHDER